MGVGGHIRKHGMTRGWTKVYILPLAMQYSNAALDLSRAETLGSYQDSAAL